MLNPTKTVFLASAENWSGTTLSPTTKLFKVQHFLLMAAGKTFNIEVQESTKHDFVAFADNTADAHDPIQSCHGKTLQECLQSMVAQLEQREHGSIRNKP